MPLPVSNQEAAYTACLAPDTAGNRGEYHEQTASLRNERQNFLPSDTSLSQISKPSYTAAISFILRMNSSRM